MYNPNHNYTDDELISLIYQKSDATQLELELAQRLEKANIDIERLELSETTLIASVQAMNKPAKRKVRETDNV